MRTIKFKGKDIKSGDWVEGDLLHGVGWKKDQVSILPFKQNLAYVKNCDPLDGVIIDPETLCQFTGLTDCNGKEIWEGDIVVFSYPHIDARIKGIVKWDAEWSCFALFKPDFKYAFESDWSRIMDRNVIGNRFDNPELMEV